MHYWTHSELDTLRADLRANRDYEAVARKHACAYEEVLRAAILIIVDEAAHVPESLALVCLKYHAPEEAARAAGHELVACEHGAAVIEIIAAIAATHNMVLSLRSRMRNSWTNKTIVPELQAACPNFSYEAYLETRLVLAEMDYAKNWAHTKHAGNLLHLCRTWRLDYRYKYILAYRTSPNVKLARCSLYPIPMPTMPVPQVRECTMVTSNVYDRDVECDPVKRQRREVQETINNLHERLLEQRAALAALTATL